MLVGGGRKERSVGRGARLFLGINQMSNESADGSFKVNVKIVTQGVAGQFEKRQANVKMPEISKAFLDKIPRRVEDAEGNEGDYANFLLIVSEDKVKQVFQSAVWVLRDRSP